ncbi:MAG: beta-propeller domain-containing protein [Deltaproteobacteria bacterium]
MIIREPFGVRGCRGAMPALMVVFASLLLAACGGGGAEGPEVALPGPPAGPDGTVLSQPRDCGQLLDALVADGTAKIAVQAENLRTDQANRGVTFGGGPLPATPELGSDGADGGLSETNVQTAGVDEADTVETEDGWIHILHGNEFVSFAVEAPAWLAQVSRVAIQGDPISMFVVAGRAVIFSAIRDQDEEFGASRDLCGGLGRPFPEPLLVDAEFGMVACVPSYTKVTVLDLTANSPTVVREFALQGSFAAARRHGSLVRLAVSGGLGIPATLPDFWQSFWSGPQPEQGEAAFAALVDAWEAEAISAIERSTLDDWLPAGFERIGGRASEWSRLPPACDQVSVPEAGLADHGMTRLFSFDLSEDTGAVADMRILGYAARLYAGTEYLLLAQEEWGWRSREPAHDRTLLHLFRIAEGAPALAYVASSFVSGVPHDQFSFDIADDVLRVSTTTRTMDASPGLPGDASITNAVSTLRIGADSLAPLGTTGPLAPGEQIFATRFLGDTGYLVTFRRIDPLFVIDLSDPANPTVLGELELPGFSDYIHPLGDDHLLTVGRAGTAAGNLEGVALRVFDVSDPTDPRLRAEFVPEGSSWTAASNDHHLFTFRASDGLLALPIEGSFPDWSSSLHLFAIKEDGILGLGRILHHWQDDFGCTATSPTPPDSCRRPPPMMRRGLFGTDIVYSLSVAALEAHDIANLETPIARVYLNDPWARAASPAGLLD